MKELTEVQLEKRVAKQNRRSERQSLQKKLYKLLEGKTLWGKMARPAQLKAGAKMMARNYSAAQLREARAR